MTEQDLPAALKRELQPDRVAPVAAWLISDQCSLNGETIITGGGRISRARNRETSSRSLRVSSEYKPEAIQSAWEDLESQQFGQAYKGALEQFGKFMSD
jgi:hypothetical protein